MRLIAAFVSLVVSLTLIQAAYAIPTQKSSQKSSILKARKLILQLQSWNLEDESPPEGQFRALQKQVSSSVIQLYKDGRVKDAITLAAWNKAVSSKHFSKESIPYLAAMSDMVVASANQKNHKAQVREFDQVFEKLSATDRSKEAKEIKEQQATLLVVNQTAGGNSNNPGSKVKVIRSHANADSIAKHIEFVKRQQEQNRRNR